MSSIQIVTAAEEQDIGDLARAVQWAGLLVDAALPLDAPLPPVLKGLEDRVPASIMAVEESRVQFRAEAFSQVLAALISGGYLARPSVLEALAAGRMPPVEES